MFALNQKYTIGKVGFSWSTLPNCEGKKSREQRWKIPATSSPVAAPCLGPGESGCGARAEVALVVTQGLEGTRVTEEWMAACLPLLSPAGCHPRVWVQLFELPEDIRG